MASNPKQKKRKQTQFARLLNWSGYGHSHNCLVRIVYPILFVIVAIGSGIAAFEMIGTNVHCLILGIVVVLYHLQTVILFLIARKEIVPKLYTQNHMTKTNDKRALKSIVNSWDDEMLVTRLVTDMDSYLTDIISTNATTDTTLTTISALGNDTDIPITPLESATRDAVDNENKSDCDYDSNCNNSNLIHCDKLLNEVMQTQPSQSNTTWNYTHCSSPNLKVKWSTKNKDKQLQQQRKKRHKNGHKHKYKDKEKSLMLAFTGTSPQEPVFSRGDDVDSASSQIEVANLAPRGHSRDIKRNEINIKFDRFDHEYINRRLCLETIIIFLLVSIPYISDLFLATNEMCSECIFGDSLRLSKFAQKHPYIKDFYRISKIFSIFRLLSLMTIVFIFRIYYHLFGIEFKNKILLKYKLFNPYLESVLFDSFCIIGCTRRLLNAICNCCCCNNEDNSDSMNSNNELLNKKEKRQRKTTSKSSNKNKTSNVANEIELNVDNNLPFVLNHSNFMTDMNELFAPFNAISKIFTVWITVFLMFNVATYLLLLIATYYLITDPNNDNSCEIHSAFYLHYWLELVSFLFAWLLVIEPLASNHRVLVRFRNWFGCHTIVKCNNFQDNKMLQLHHIALTEKMLIQEYLATITRHCSPFCIGPFAPTPQNLKSLLIFTFVTLAAEMLIFLVKPGK